MPDRDATERASLYASELRFSLRNNAGAYGFSVMITGSMALLTSQYESPTMLQVFLFFFGAVLSFAGVEAIATRGFRRSLSDEEGTVVVALGASLSLFSIGIALAMVVLCTMVLPATTGWLIAPFAGSMVYLLVTGVEMGIARRIEERRGIE